jgi:hypothetical protein
VKSTLLAALALAGCTSFDSLQRNTCGNGLVEEGEDCDSTAATCVRCGITCDESTPCGDGYACGVDGFCHAPGGALGRPVQGGSFLADEYRVTDVDGDDIGDVIGLSKTSIVIRHGAASGSLSNVESQLTPAQTGPAAFGDLDGDGSLDLTIATPDGLVSYASPYGDLSAVPVSAAITDAMTNQPVDLRYAFTINPLVLGAFFADNGNIFVVLVDFLNQSASVAAAPCGMAVPVAQFSPDLVDSYSTPDGADTVITMPVTGGKLCVMALHHGLLQSTITAIPPAAAPTITHRAVLADLDNDGDPCPDVINSEGGAGALRHWDGVMLGGHCTLKAAAIGGDPLPPIPGAPNGVAVGRIELKPPQGGAAPDALVTSDGVYFFGPAAPAGFVNVYRSTRKLAHAYNADIDGDGQTDAILSAEQQDDLDILYRSLLGTFQLLRIDTATEVATVATGDFDANGYLDIAYTERLPDHQRLAIAWGTSDRPLDPVPMVTFPDVTNIARVNFPSSTDPLFQVDDIIVLEPPLAGRPTAYSILVGSTQRTVIPYFDPRLDARKNDTIFRAAVIGNFAPAQGGPDRRDVVGLAPTRPGAATSGVRAWRVPGTDAGLDGTTNDGVMISGVNDCSLSPGSGLCIEDAVYLPWPIASDKDIVFAIDRASPAHAVVVDPWSGSLTAQPVSGITSMIPAGSVVHSLHAADVDGDGALDLVAAFQPRESGKGGVLVCGVSGSTVGTCTDLVTTITAAAPGTKSCVDATPSHVRAPVIGAPLASDVIALCHDDGSTIYRVYHDESGFHAEPLAHVAAPLTAIEVGDVTGDGVEDVVATAGDRGSQSLIVFPQCTTRTAATCGKGDSQ